MKVLQVFNFRNLYGSGLTTSVPGLCAGLASSGVDIELFAPRAREEWLNEAYRMRVFPVVPGFESVGWCPSMKRALHQSAGNADLIHCHEIWTLPGAYASTAALDSNIPCVISPRGTLSASAQEFSGWKKRLMWKVSRRKSLLRATCLHATAEHEFSQIRDAGYTGPVAVIPNAVTVPELAQVRKTGKHRLVYLARIHPIKGVMTLVEAWGKLSVEFPNWSLAIAGVDDGAFVEQLKSRIAALKLERITFPGPQYREAKTGFLSKADLYCLPTTSDNFAITVGEALAHRLPVVTTTAAPWSGVIDNECGWWVEPDLHSVQGALRQAMALSRLDRQKMGNRGREWVEASFGAQTVCNMMNETYKWVLGKRECPEWVEQNAG